MKTAEIKWSLKIKRTQMTLENPLIEMQAHKMVSLT